MVLLAFLYLYNYLVVPGKRTVEVYNRHFSVEHICR